MTEAIATNLRAFHIAIERRIVNVHAIFDEFLASGIAGIQFNGGVSSQFRAKVCACRLPDSRGTRDENGAINVHPVLAWFLEPRLIAALPEDHFRTIERGRHSATYQSISHC